MCMLPFAFCSFHVCFVCHDEDHLQDWFDLDCQCLSRGHLSFLWTRLICLNLLFQCILWANLQFQFSQFCIIKESLKAWQPGSSKLFASFFPSHELGSHHPKAAVNSQILDSSFFCFSYQSLKQPELANCSNRWPPASSWTRPHSLVFNGTCSNQDIPLVPQP